MRRARRGLRAGRIGCTFHGVVILRVAANVIRSLQGDLLADSIETGVSTTDSTMVIADIACRGVELVGKFSSLRAHPRGNGVHKPPECVQLNKGYAPGTSSDDSTRLKPT